MDKSSFLQSLQSDNPPVHVSTYALALWYDARGNWQKAHEIIQDINDTRASKIHAYLHRKEGDIFNADYWYRKAQAERPQISLDAEWALLVEEFV